MRECCILSICLSCACLAPAPPSSCVAADITVDAASGLGEISRGLFTHNHRIAENGFGVWDQTRNRIRPDIITCLKGMGATGLRFPGGSVGNNYDWRHGVIFPRTDRPKFAYKKEKHKHMNPMHNYGLMEHFQLVEALGQDAVDWTAITLRRVVQSIEEAADYVEFLNSPHDGQNPNGGRDWAGYRASMGHPEPYRVQWWCLGNEIGHHARKGRWENIGLYLDGYTHKGMQCPGILALSDAMKAVDPGIKVGSGCQDADFLRALNKRKRHLDFIDAHFWIISHAKGTLQDKHYCGIRAATHLADRYRELNKLIASLPHLRGKMQVISMETDAGHMELQTTLSHGLANAVSWITFIESGATFMSHTPLTSTVHNPFGKRIPFLLFRDDYADFLVHAPSWPYQLLARRLGRHRVAASIAGNPAIRVPADPSLGHAAWSEKPGTISTLYAVAGKDASGKTLDLIVVNVHAEEAVNAAIHLRHFRPRAEAEVREYNAEALDAENTFNQKHHVGIAEKTIDHASEAFHYTFPAHSVIALRFTRR